MNCQTEIQYKQKQSTKLTMADFNRQGCKPAMSGHYWLATAALRDFQIQTPSLSLHQMEDMEFEPKSANLL
jgi:hypothetical protein